MWPHRAGMDCLRIVRQQGRPVLVSKSEDGVLATWDPQTGCRLLCLRVNPSAWHSLAHAHLVL